MSYFKAVFDTGRPLGVKVPEEKDIHDKMSVNPLFPDPPVPYADFLIALKDQDLAIQNAEFGGLERTAAKKAAERIVDDMVRKLREYVSLKANGDTTIILSSGFKHTKPRQSSGEMPKVEAVKRFNTEKSGELKLDWKRIKNAGFYEVQVRPMDDPKPPMDPNNPAVLLDEGEEDDWQKYSVKPSRIVIFGLQPLTYYAVRVRANGTKGFGSFSDTLIVLVT
jgi:hypothetical protein